MSVRAVTRSRHLPGQVERAQRVQNARPNATGAAGWTAQLREDVHDWLLSRTFLPTWPTENGYRTIATYLIAALAPAGAAAIDLALTRAFPALPVLGLLEIFAVVLVALRLGVGPSLVATALGALLLNSIVLTPRLVWNVYAAEDVAATLLFLAIGTAVGVVAGETERARRAALAAKERSNEFVSVVSHELRQPLTGIKGSLQFTRRQLKKIVRDAPQQRTLADSAESNAEQTQRLQAIDSLLESAERQSSLMDRLVADLLDSTRIEASKLNIRLEGCDPVEIVRLAVEEQRQAWPEREILLDTSAGRKLHVLADPTRIGQVVTNYLTNALKYAPPNRPIVVRVRRRHTEAQVSVRDEGPGLPPVEQRRIWERFHRAKGVEAGQNAGAGLGLGLYISKTIIERHGGRVGVISAPGRGSTFWFRLPLASERRVDHTIEMHS